MKSQSGYCTIAYNCCKVYRTLAKKKELCCCLNQSPSLVEPSVWDTTWNCFSASAADLVETSVPGPGWSTSRHLAWRVTPRMSELDEEVKGAPGCTCTCGPAATGEVVAQEKQQGSSRLSELKPSKPRYWVDSHTR